MKTADQLAKSESMGTSAGAMAAFKGKPKSTMDSKDKKFFCKFHGKNILHNSEKCKKLIADAGKVADGEHAHMAAGVSQIASPPTSRNPSQKSDSYWNADSGATSHMTSHKEWLRNLQPCCIPIHLADNKVIYAIGRGTVVFNPIGNMCSIVMPSVLYVPELKNNLFSIVSSILDSKLRVEIEGTSLVFKKDKETILTGSIRGKIAMLDGHTLACNKQDFVAAITKDLLHQ